MNNCYLCKGTNLHVVSETQRHETDGIVVQCDDCFLIQQQPLVSADYYDTEYNKQYSRVNPQVHFNNSKIDDLRRVKYLVQDGSFRLLDIGCASGSFMSCVKDMLPLATVFGIEPDEQYHDYCNAKGQIVVKSIVGDVIPFNVITMWHSLEHLEDPISELKRIARWLTDDGRIFIEVPNADDILLLLPEYQAFYWQPAHNFYFSAYTLKAVIEQAGLSCAISQVQRYSMDNHYCWATTGRGNGDMAEYDSKYGQILSAFGKADTLVATCTA
jgi:SAM-dependent methyltransferase